MPSRRFEAVLSPDPALRRLVMLAACTGLLTGFVLIIRLPVSAWIRFGLTMVWLASQVREIGRLTRGAARVRTIRLGPDSATVINRKGREEPVQIMSGSVVLPKLAWLRLRLSDGLCYGELLRGNSARDRHWRCLQILWRQGPAAFGATPEADTISNRKSGSHF
ncbi:MAG: hypothetical protein ACE5OQ_03885 [Woeseia sp.]